MANNPLTVNNLTPLTTNLLSFQWALNPDGDSSTASDMPDVINNVGTSRRSRYRYLQQLGFAAFNV